MKNISNVKNSCVGCRSCEQVCPKRAIVIREQEEGFLYPYVDEEKCIDCSLCVKHCPTQVTKNNSIAPISVFAFRNKNDAQIMQSASGGVGVLTAQKIIEENGVSYGVAYDEGFRAKHIRVDDLSELPRIQSSKYVQSDTGDTYSQVQKDLQSGKKVLYTGTPCQIDGLYSFLGKDYENLYTIDLICHGVPSPKFFKKYLEFRDRRTDGKTIYFNFRSKDKRGWGTQYLLKTKTKTRTKTKVLSLDRYGKHFVMGDCYRESCYQCDYANIHRVGDLTIGDFWGIGKSHPDFYSEKGVSSILVNTEKGQKLFNSIKSEGWVINATLEEAMVKQGNLVHPTKRPLERDTFYRNIDRDDFIDNLKVGLQLKDRVKSILPRNLVRFLKQIR